jgi:hypothetical protein
VGIPLQKESFVTSEDEVKGNSIEVIYFIIFLALPFIFAATSVLLLAINTLDKMRNFTVRAGGGAACVCVIKPQQLLTHTVIMS